MPKPPRAVLGSASFSVNANVFSAGKRRVSGALALAVSLGVSVAPKTSKSVSGQASLSVLSNLAARGTRGTFGAASLSQAATILVSGSRTSTGAASLQFVLAVGSSGARTTLGTTRVPLVVAVNSRVASNAAGSSTASFVFTATTKPTETVRAMNIRAGIATAAETVEWDEVPGATGYRVTCEVDGTSIAVPADARWWQVEALGPGRREQGIKWGRTKKTSAVLGVTFGSTIRASKNNQAIVPFEITVGTRVAGTVASPPQPAQTPPTVSVDSPTDGATITTNSVAFYASARDDEGIERVELYVNDGFKRSEVDPPFGWGGSDGAPNLDLTGYQDGPIKFKAIAYDVTGLTAQDEVSCTLSRTPTSTALFDGRAALVDSMRGTTYGASYGTGAYMNPRIYNEDIATYYENDISLLADSRFTKVFKVALNQDSRNPGWVGQPSTKPSAEITERRPISIGQIDWYSFSIKWMAGWQAGAWGVCVQLGYPTLTSPPLAVAISKVGGVPKIGIDRHAGTVTSGTSGLTNVEQRFHNLSDVQGKWVDWLIGVKWEINNTGWVQVETRVEGGSWAVRYNPTNTPTWQQQSGQSPKPTVMDKMGAYQDASGLTAPWTNTLHNSGLTRWTDEASARAWLG